MDTKGLILSVDIDNPIAVYVQVENQIKFAVHAGKLMPGDRLPTVRELCERLQVNPNTIAKAYRDLELLRLVSTRRGVGVTVTDAAPGICAAEVPKLVEQHVRDAIGECLAAGLSEAAIREMVAEAVAGKAAPYQGGPA